MNTTPSSSRIGGVLTSPSVPDLLAPRDDRVAPRRRRRHHVDRPEVVVAHADVGEAAVAERGRGRRQAAFPAGRCRTSDRAARGIERAERILRGRDDASPSSGPPSKVLRGPCRRASPSRPRSGRSRRRARSGRCAARRAGRPATGSARGRGAAAGRGTSRRLGADVVLQHAGAAIVGPGRRRARRETGRGATRDRAAATHHATLGSRSCAGQRSFTATTNDRRACAAGRRRASRPRRRPGPCMAATTAIAPARAGAARDVRDGRRMAPGRR